MLLKYLNCTHLSHVVKWFSDWLLVSGFNIFDRFIYSDFHLGGGHFEWYHATYEHIWTYETIKGTDVICLQRNKSHIIGPYINLRNSRATKSSYKIELRKMAAHFVLLTQKCLQKFFFLVTNSTLLIIGFHFELLTWRLNFYYYTFELLNLTLSY